MDSRPRKLHGLLPLLQLVEPHHVCIRRKHLFLVLKLCDETPIVNAVGAGGGAGGFGGCCGGRRGGWGLIHCGAFGSDLEAVREVHGFFGFGDLAISFCTRGASEVGAVEAFNSLMCSCGS